MVWSPHTELEHRLDEENEKLRERIERLEAALVEIETSCWEGEDTTDIILDVRRMCAKALGRPRQRK